MRASLFSTMEFSIKEQYESNRFSNYRAHSWTLKPEAATQKYGCKELLTYSYFSKNKHTKILMHSFLSRRNARKQQIHGKIQESFSTEVVNALLLMSVCDISASLTPNVCFSCPLWYFLISPTLVYVFCPFVSLPAPLSLLSHSLSSWHLFTSIFYVKLSH